MANRKRRSLEELYKLTGNLSKPKITPILQGNYHMQGPVDDSDNGIEINKEADSGDKILVEESNQHSFDSSDTVPILKTRACDDQRHTSSGTSNLASPSSSHDSFFENAESKATMRTSDTSDCSLLDNGIKEQADEQILECHGDSISCVAGVKNTSKLISDPIMGLDGMNGSCCTDSTRREGFEKVLEVDTSHDSLIDCSCGGEGGKTNIKDPSSKKNPSKATAGFSHDSDPSEFPSSIEGITSPKAEVPSSDSRSTSSVIYTADSKDLEENSSSRHGAGPSECSTEHDEPSLPEPVTTNDINGSKSAAPDSFDILSCPEDTKAGHIRSNSSAEAVMKFYPCLETENSVDLLASDAEKREPPSGSQQASESDHSGSDLLEDDVKVCDICGDAGREDLLAVCSRCNDGAEHTYCMQTMLDKVPEGDWLCEECKLKEDAETQKSYASESTSTTPKLSISNDKIENCKGTFNLKALSTLDTKVLCTNRNKPLKAISNPQLPVKRHSENQEVASTTRKQVVEMATGLQGVVSPGKKPALSREASIKNVDTGNPGKKPALSRDTSLKNMDIGKVKLTHLATLPGSHSANNSRETGKSLSNFGSNSPAILTKLQSSLSSKLAVPGSSESGSASPSGSSNFAPKHHIHSKAPDSPVPRPKLSVFQNLNLKTKVKQVWEDPSQKQKLARESTNSDVKKEGLVRTLSRSMSNSSFRFRSNSGESKTKMQNLNLFRTEDSRGLKQAEESSHSMERKNSFKSDYSLTTSSLTAAARISHPKVDPKIIIPHGQNVSLPVHLVSNHSDLKATEVDGKIKTSAEPTVLAPVKGSENTIASAGIGVMKKQLLPNSGDFEGTGCNPDMVLQDGLSPSLESTNRDGRSRQSFMPGGRAVPQVRCFKCKEIGHIALYCNSNLCVSAVTTSVSLPVPLVSNHSDLKATEVDGKIKTSAEPTVLAPVKGSENTIASVGIGDMKKQLLPNSGDFEGTGGNPDMLLQDGLSPSLECTNRDGRSRQSFMPGRRAVPQVRCFKCKEIGHIALYCNSNLRVSAVTTSAARNSREVTAKSKWKNVVEAAMTKKTRIGETNVLLDRSDELSMLNTVPSCEQVSKDHLSKSIGVDIDINITANSIPSRMKRLPSVEGAIDVQGSLRIPAADHARTTALVGIKQHAFANPTRTSAIPEQHYLWQGGFEVQRSGRFPDCFDGIQAHLSTFASPKVLEVANKLPCKLQLEEVPRLRSWPKQFQGNYATEDNIALYFFAKDLESYERNYKNLLESMRKNDSALKGDFDGIELLIFPSDRLPEKSQRWNRLFFLWGVFRGRKGNCLDRSTASLKKLSVNSLDARSSILGSPIMTEISMPQKISSYMHMDRASSKSDRPFRPVETIKSKVSVDLPLSSSPGRDHSDCHAKDCSLDKKSAFCKLDQSAADTTFSSEKHSSCSIPETRPSTSVPLVTNLNDICSSSPVLMSYTPMCSEVKSNKISLKEVYRDVDSRKDIELQTSVQAANVQSSPRKGKPVSMIVDTSNCKQASLFSSLLKKQDTSSDSSKVIPINIYLPGQEAGSSDSRGKFDDLEAEQRQEILKEIERFKDDSASLGRDEQMSEPLTKKEHCSWESRSNKKRPRSHSSETASEASGETSKDTSQAVTWKDKSDCLSMDRDNDSKKLKCQSELFARTGAREHSLCDGDFAYDGNLTPENSRTAERYFFPVDLGCVKDSKPGSSGPWPVFLTNDESPPEPDAPNLELALGAEKRTSNKGILPLFVQFIDKEGTREKPPDPVVADDMNSDISSSLSLSLAFPFSEKDCAAKPVSRTEQHLPDRHHVNTSLILFGGYTDT